jgi:hypothetical protein
MTTVKVVEDIDEIEDPLADALGEGNAIIEL